METPISKAREAVEHTLTHRDLDFTPDDGNRYEVIDGELCVSPFPTPAHQRVITALVRILGTHVLDGKLGEVFAAGLKVVLDEPTGVGPDLVYISAARLGELREDGFYGPPDLLVEVVSSRPQLDRFVKFHKYARAGVPHYWIIDPRERRLDAYRLEAGRYAVDAEVAGSGDFEPALFPGLVVPLRALWS